MTSRKVWIAAMSLVAGACAEASTAPGGADITEGGGDSGGEGEGEAAPGDPGPKPAGDEGVGDGSGGGQGGDGGAAEGGDAGAGNGGGDAGQPPGGGDEDGPCEYRQDQLFVCGPDWLIVNLADGGTVREAALPPGSVAVVQAAVGVDPDGRAHRFVRLGKPGAVDPARDEAPGLALLLWSDRFAPAAGEDGGAEVTEERSDDGTRLSWQASSQDVRYGMMYALRGGDASSKTLLPPRSGGLGAAVLGLADDGAVSLPVSPLPDALLVQWSAAKSLLCPGLPLAADAAAMADLAGLLDDPRLSRDHKLLAVLDLVDAVGAVLWAAAPGESAGCIRSHLVQAVEPTLGAAEAQAADAEELIGAIVTVLAGALGQESGEACLGGGATLLPSLAEQALSALGGVTELAAGDVDGLPDGCEHAAIAGFRAEIELPFEPLQCDAAETCDDGYDDDCSGAVDDDARCGCDADRYEPFCDGDDLRERNGCGEARDVRRCDHGCRDDACQGCEDPSYDRYCELGGDDLWEENDCGTTRFVQNCEFGCDNGRCQECQDPSYDRFCQDDGDLWERNDCGDERGLANCACGCSAPGGRAACNDLVCAPGARRCGDDVQETCVGGCGWDAPANCACGCDGEGEGRSCGAVPPSDGGTALDREGNDDASTRRQGDGWVISGAGQVGGLWSDGHDDVILITGYAQEGDDDWYYLLVDDGGFGSLQPRVLLEPPATVDLDLRVAYLNNADREFVPECSTGRECAGIAGHAGCCSTLGAGQDDEVRFDAETGIGQENSGVLLIRVQSFRTPNICDFYHLWVWL